jgi:hypothetical protein
LWSFRLQAAGSLVFFTKELFTKFIISRIKLLENELNLLKEEIRELKKIN